MILCIATSAVKNSEFLIEHRCPQCGAPAVLTETDRLFTCDFCKVRSYLMTDGCFRYLLPSNAPPGREVFWLPFWRFKGMLFYCSGGGVGQKFVDLSRSAVDVKGFPVSLGFRSQALKLRFVTPETDGRFLRTRRTLDQVMADFETNFTLPLPKPIYHLTHIGEHLSLIYAPYYLTGSIYDAVLNEPLAGGASSTEIESELSCASGPGWELEFLPTLCPACGWDLEGARDSLVLLCKNCTSAWQPLGRRLQKLRFGHLPADDDQVLYLPFWRIRAEVSGIDLSSYADLVRTANLPRVIHPEWGDRPFWFWSPAFKIRPQTFLPLAVKMTLTQPEDTPEAQLPPGNRYPVTLQIREALESLKIILADFIKPRKVHYPRLPDIRIVPRSYLLVYVPFQRQHHDLVQPTFRVSILKNQLKLSGIL
jgi:hypothetical protein